MTALASLFGLGSVIENDDQVAPEGDEEVGNRLDSQGVTVDTAAGKGRAQEETEEATQTPKY